MGPDDWTGALGVVGTRAVCVRPSRLASVGTDQTTDLVERSNSGSAQGVPVIPVACDDVDRITGQEIQDERLVVLHAPPRPSWQLGRHSRRVVVPIQINPRERILARRRKLRVSELRASL